MMHEYLDAKRTILAKIREFAKKLGVDVTTAEFELLFDILWSTTHIEAAKPECVAAGYLLYKRAADMAKLMSVSGCANSSIKRWAKRFREAEEAARELGRFGYEAPIWNKLEKIVKTEYSADLKDRVEEYLISTLTADILEYLNESKPELLRELFRALGLEEYLDRKDEFAEKVRYAVSEVLEAVLKPRLKVEVEIEKPAYPPHIIGKAALLLAENKCYKPDECLARAEKEED